MTPPVIHDTFTIERTYPQSRERVLRGFSDPARKRRWFAEGEGFVVDSYGLDFRVGGTESSRFRFGDGPPMTYDATYLDIAIPDRVVFAYAMTFDGRPMSSSLVSIELTTVAEGTHLRFTEQTAYVDGNDGSSARREGSIALLEALAGELSAHD